MCVSSTNLSLFLLVVKEQCEVGVRDLPDREGEYICREKSGTRQRGIDHREELLNRYVMG